MVFLRYFFASFKTIPLRCFSVAASVGDSSSFKLSSSSSFITLTVQFESGVGGFARGEGEWSGEFRGVLFVIMVYEGERDNDTGFGILFGSIIGDDGALNTLSLAFSTSDNGNLRWSQDGSRSSSGHTCRLASRFCNSFGACALGESTGVLTSERSSNICGEGGSELGPSLIRVDRCRRTGWK